MNTQQKARDLRSNMTDAERKLWQGLRQHQLNGYKFRRQQPLGPYIVDFVCFEARLIVELDGSQHQQQEAYDHARDAWLRQQGYRVLRFWNNAVFENRDGVLMSILAELTTPHPNPPPQGGRGPELRSPQGGRGPELRSPQGGRGPELRSPQEGRELDATRPQEGKGPE